MSKHSTEEKKKRKQKAKEKKKQKHAAKLQQETQNKEKLDVLCLLREERQDSKPNLGKFLKTYVACISTSIGDSKIQLYPVFSYELRKVFVKFADRQELIKVYNSTEPTFYLYDGIEEKDLTDKDIKLIAQFFVWLETFEFVH